MVSEQAKLLALLTIHQSNMHILHWNAQGHEFDVAHKDFTSEYYTKMFEDTDAVAENIMRMGGTSLNYTEIITTLKEAEMDTKIFSTQKLYTRDEIVNLSQMILDEICNQIISVLGSDEIQNNPRNVGIKSYYEGLLDSYDLECRYLNPRRIMK